MKPQAQWLATVLENGSRRRRTLVLAFPAMPQSTIRVPRTHGPAPGADKSLGPPDPLKILHAVLLGRKPLKKFLESSWERVLRRCSHAATTTHCGHLSQSATQIGH
jgi:hypothetical protein